MVQATQKRGSDHQHLCLLKLSQVNPISLKTWIFSLLQSACSSAGLTNNLLGTAPLGMMRNIHKLFRTKQKIKISSGSNTDRKFQTYQMISSTYSPTWPSSQTSGILYQKSLDISISVKKHWHNRNSRNWYKRKFRLLSLFINSWLKTNLNF